MGFKFPSFPVSSCLLLGGTHMYIAHADFHTKGNVEGVDNSSVEFYSRYHFSLHCQHFKKFLENFQVAC